MDEELAIRFEASRPRLRAVGYRMLGSLSDADDAVQEAWIRASSADRSAVRSMDAWLTTILARVCLDMLRWRKTRREEPLDVSAEPAGRVAPEPAEEAELADSVGHALLVVMDRLAPAERVAYVLHDMFAVPFGEIGAVTGRTPAAARKLASRARQRIAVPSGTAAPAGTTPAGSASAETTLAGTTPAGSAASVAAAFLAAARLGDLDRLLAILDPSVVLHADAAASPTGAPATLRGAAAVAGNARIAYARAAFSGVAMVDGRPGIVMTAGGQLQVALAFAVRDGLVTSIDVIADPARLAILDVAVLA